VSDLVAYARELEAEDGALAEAIAAIEALRRELFELRGRAAHAVTFVAGLPEARTGLAAALRDAGEELERRRREAAEADARLERAAKEEEVLAARRAVVRTRDAATTAGRKVERLRGEAEALEAEAHAIEAGLPELERRAAELVDQVRALHRASDPGLPAPGAAGVAAWASRAEASLFVARGGLETERDRVIRQANELAAAALGETLASNVRRVREQLEQRQR
jgi:DNA repair exonuclease SbcCD ATPase subunit